LSDSFVHIHTHTEYSMLDGASRIDELMRSAAEQGMPAMAITDHGVMYGAVDFYQAGRRHGVKPIIGSELYVATRSRFEKSSREKDSNHHMTAVAETDEGYRNLMKLVSLAHLEGYYYRPRVDKELLAQHAKGIIATSGCLAGEVGQLLLQGQVEQATKVVGEYREIFGPDNFFVELQDHGLADQHTVFPHLIDIARRTGTRLLATNDLHYTHKQDAPVHDVLLCIQTGSTINEPGRFKFDAEEFFLKSPEQMRALFRDHPDACDATLEIAERCNVTLEMGVQRLPVFVTPTGESVDAYLRRLTYEGAAARYGDPLTDEVRERIEFELSTIASMGFASYFLIVADLIAYAKANGVRCGPGRGSSAGSIVSYCLGIVGMDPIKYRLMFERFLNPARKEMPDIDMDFDVRGRGEVLRYAVRKYGEERVAQIVTFATIKGKQAIRDAARVLGMPYVVGDRLARAYPPGILGKDPPLAACFDQSFEWPPGDRGNQAYAGASDMRSLYQTDPDSKQVIDVARGLEGLRRQAGVHAAGVVISDRPLVEVVPVRRARSAEDGLPRAPQPYDPRGRDRPAGEARRDDRHRRDPDGRSRDVRDAEPRRDDGRVPAGVAADARRTREAAPGPVRGHRGHGRALPAGPDEGDPEVHQGQERLIVGPVPPPRARAGAARYARRDRLPRADPADPAADRGIQRRRSGPCA